MKFARMLFVILCAGSLYGQVLYRDLSANDIIITNMSSIRVYESVTGLVVDAQAQREVIVNLTNDVTILAPTNMVDGSTFKWRFVGNESNHEITWPTEFFRIPSSSSMSNIVVLGSNSISFFVTEYMLSRAKWAVQSYVPGY